jgi:hypothetical protein
VPRRAHPAFSIDILDFSGHYPAEPISKPQFRLTSAECRAHLGAPPRGVGGVITPAWGNHINTVYKYGSIHVPVIRLGVGGYSIDAEAPIWTRGSSLAVIALQSSGPRPMPSNF